MSHGAEPLFSQDRKLSLSANGEIYNYKDLRARIGDESRFRTNSDCEPIVHLYEQVGNDVAAYLDGDFAFVILNKQTGALYAARDPIGVNSLYWGTGLDGSTWFASEAKPLVAFKLLFINVMNRRVSQCLIKEVGNAQAIKRLNSLKLLQRAARAYIWYASPTKVSSVLVASCITFPD